MATASTPATFTDLSGVVQSLLKDLEGKTLSQTDLIKQLPQLVLTAWTLNLPIEKAEAQVLAAVKHLVEKFVPAAHQAAVTAFVDTAFPAILTALNGLIEQVKAEVLKKATDVVGDVTEKVEAVCSKSCLPWMSALFAKGGAKPAAAPVPAAVAVAVPAEIPATVPAEIPATVPVESVEAAAASDISAALAPAKESVLEPATESKA